MPKFFKKKLFFYLFSIGLFSLALFITVFSLPSFSAGTFYCNIGEPDRCNPKIPNLIITCDNDCDADADSEWCNTTNCAAAGKVCRNGFCVDQVNANTSGCTDADKDGYGTTGSTGCPKSETDCNDNGAAIYPGAKEICGNTIDEDCNGTDLVCADTTAPIVKSFSATHSLGSVTLNWSIKDAGGSHLKQAEFWRAPTVGNVSGTWTELIGLRQSLSSQNIDINTGIVTDNPAPGTYWYGVHALDKSNNTGTEPTPPGPIKVVVLPATCTENWSCVAWSACSAGQQTRTCADANSCGTTASKPAVSQTCSCTENWSCGAWSACVGGNQTRTCADANDCGTTASKPAETQSCSTLTISILSPNSFELLYNTQVNFKASALGGSYPYNYSWQSNLDGNLYTGFTNNFSTKTLRVGAHAITLTVTDNLGATAVKNFDLIIRDANSMFVSISAPSDGNQFSVGSSIFFNSFISKAKSPAIFSWSSDRDGIISTSNFFSLSTLSLGDHKITLTVTDATPLTITKFINIKIISGLLLKINIPKSGTYEQGINTFFNAGVDGGTSPYAFTWSSNKDRQIYSGPGVSSPGSQSSSFSKNNLSLGTHLITVVATDALGATASASVTIEIIAPQCLDDDKDGYGKVVSSVCPKANADCNDTNPSINPGATEICGNAVDENCNSSLTDCPVIFTVLSPASDGLTFSWGNAINIRIQGASITSATITIYNSADVYIQSVGLYNDGAHNDGAANDDIWGNNTILPFPNNNYHFGVYINNLTYNNIRNFNINNAPTCTTVVNNGSSADKLDIVFIADQYTSAEMPNFITKVNSTYAYLFGTIPFNNQNSKINIHRVDSPVNLGCAAWGTNQPNCNGGNIIQIAQLCPGDRTIVLVDGSFRSYAYFGGYAVVAANSTPGYTTVHEFGHSFGLLDDEYVDGGISDRGAASVNASINCDTSSVCTKWRTPKEPVGTLLPGTGCFTGCDYRDVYYRSINSGIMSTNGATDYGVLNINALNLKFNSYK